MGFGFAFAAQRGNELIEWLRAEVAFAAMAHGDGAGFGFFGARRPACTEFSAAARREFWPAAFRCGRRDARAGRGASEFRLNVFRVVGEFFADGTNGDLHGGKPQRKSSGVVLDENAEETFDRAEQRAMDHQRLMPRAVFADVLQAEARGQIEIELDGGQLPGAADGVDQFDVDLGAVKRGFAFACS